MAVQRFRQTILNLHRGLQTVPGFLSVWWQRKGGLRRVRIVSICRRATLAGRPRPPNKKRQRIPMRGNVGTTPVHPALWPRWDNLHTTEDNEQTSWTFLKLRDTGKPMPRPGRDWRGRATTSIVTR